MTTTKTVIGTALVAATLTATTVAAQTAFTGTDVAAERNEALLEAIEDDTARDPFAFGNEGRPQGFTGSIALRSSVLTGNTDTTDLGVGANFGYVDGPNGYDVQLNYSYGTDSGTVTEQSLFYGVEYTRDVNDNLFGFAKVQGTVDQFSSFETDTFAGFGAGYRIYNTSDMQWSVQAGPGYRIAEFNGASPDISEAAFALSSDLFTAITPTIGLSNDTDIIWSSSDTFVVNDLAISVALSDSMALRSSLLTTYHSNPLPGFVNTDNAFGVSVVYALK